jgi:hypothetical protein
MEQLYYELFQLHNKIVPFQNKYFTLKVKLFKYS